MVSGWTVNDNLPMTAPSRPQSPVAPAACLAGLPGLCLEMAPVGDHRAALMPEESAAIAHAAQRRVHEFSTGRWLARRAFAALGLPAAAIPRAGGRAPAWPAGVAGSITHARELAIAVVAAPGHARGIGIDLEAAGRVGTNLYHRLFTPAERAGIEAAGAARATLLFSAKEAVYKAVNPIAGRYVGFLEAEVAVAGGVTEPASGAVGSFTVRYLGHFQPNRVMESGIGRFCFFEHYVFALFMIR
jgi:4'-phosphopantetheinyl transferase EntD